MTLMNLLTTRPLLNDRLMIISRVVISEPKIWKDSLYVDVVVGNRNFLLSKIKNSNIPTHINSRNQLAKTGIFGIPELGYIESSQVTISFISVLVTHHVGVSKKINSKYITKVICLINLYLSNIFLYSMASGVSFMRLSNLI
jgi:hypothetical protein